MSAQQRKKSIIPVKDADLITVAQDVSKKWEQFPTFLLLWTDLSVFRQSIDLFEESFGEREGLKGIRSVVSNELHTINAEITKNTAHVKGYIAELHTKKNAHAYYAQVGIVKAGKSYIIPTDNDQRLLALGQMIRGLVQNNLNDKKYGIDYWTDVKKRFEETLAKSRAIDSESVVHINNKAKQRTLIKQTLNALIHIIKANYPKTYRDQLRVWGFQKEKY